MEQPPPARAPSVAPAGSVRRERVSRYDRKRAEGKKHIQAVLALARRRTNVIWALIRDRRCYQVTPPDIAAA